MKKSIIWQLLVLTGALLIGYALLMTGFFHVMTKEANLSHHENVVYRDVSNIAEHYTHTRAFECASGSYDVLMTLEDVTHGQLFMVQEDDQVLQVNDRGALQTVVLSALSPVIGQGVRDAREGREVHFRLKEDGVVYIYACVPIPGESGILMMRTDASAIGDAEVSDVQALVFSGLLGLFIALGLSIVLMKQIMRPLRRLMAFTDRLSHGDYAARSFINRQDEIGDLAKIMDAMAQGMEEAERQRDQMRLEQDTFLSEVSHELKTPVTVLCASVDALMEGVADTSEKKEAYLVQMKKEADWLRHLVSDLLELTRLKSTSFSIEKKPLSLTELLGDVAMSASRLAAAHGNAFECHQPQTNYILLGDYGRLRQMLMNVTDNAIKFSHPGGTVKLEMLDARPVVIVQDNGLGISQADLGQIFERYHRRYTSSVQDSTGLGLAIVRQIAIRHSIAIQVESEEGKGSSFSFDFSGALME